MRRVVKFAIFPTRVDSKLIWLMPYIELQKLIHIKRLDTDYRPFATNDACMNRTVNAAKWKTVKRKCISKGILPKSICK